MVKIPLYETYNAIVPVYERTSKAITLRFLVKWRRETIKLGLKALNDPGNALNVLDAGSGPGSMSIELIKSGVGLRHIVLLDQSIVMLNATPSLSNIDKVCGSFEYMPFRGSVFNMVIMGFSLHTANDLRRTYCEISKVLDNGGVLASISIGKPTNPVYRALGWLYTAAAIPLIALVFAGPRYVSYFYNIHNIYRRLPPNDVFRSMAEGCLRLIQYRDKALGLANIIIMGKRNHG
ncbi:class I SAM-dependent methyltransferase [Caldivirga sp. UBA161]|uniref:class I SAM-dependent methyltransferase n=1 Tax=Caldivirga sp. UBA161 TaxID=1915569 RepID=UPI0025C0213E|nr:class I SAM-dependent methyltransferase [Caldivirga sp. UBA161]